MFSRVQERLPYRGVAMALAQGRVLQKASAQGREGELYSQTREGLPHD